MRIIMQAYFFTNYYLSSIQQGIQPLHAIVELERKYRGTLMYDQYANWAAYYKTVICLNGGNSANLKDIVKLFSSTEHQYVWSSFSEDEQSLNNALTSVAIILPSRVYTAAKAIRDRRITPIQVMTLGFVEDDTDTEHHHYTEWELELIYLLNSCGLAK